MFDVIPDELHLAAANHQIQNTYALCYLEKVMVVRVTHLISVYFALSVRICFSTFPLKNPTHSSTLLSLSLSLPITVFSRCFLSLPTPSKTHHPQSAPNALNSKYSYNVILRVALFNLFTIQISIHNTLLINTAFICIKYNAEGKQASENDEAKKRNERWI